MKVLILKKFNLCALSIFMIFFGFLHFSWAGTVTLPKTGQISCYNTSGVAVPCSGTGQDGDTLKGASWPVPRFSDNGDGTLTDNLTGLIWLKDANCMATNYAEVDTDGDSDGNVAWQNALDFVAGIQFVLAGSAGLYKYRFLRLLVLDNEYKL